MSHVVLLDFWATWSTGCKVEIPWYLEFAKKHEHSGLAVVGVPMDKEGWTVVKPFMREKQMNYPVVLGDDDLANRYKLTFMPLTSGLLDSSGLRVNFFAQHPYFGPAQRWRVPGGVPVSLHVDYDLVSLIAEQHFPSPKGQLIGSVEDSCCACNKILGAGVRGATQNTRELLRELRTVPK